MLHTLTAALCLVTPALSAQQLGDDDVERGALALRQFVGSRVVVDSASDVGVDVVGSVEDLVLDIESGLVTRVLVRDAPAVDKSEPEDGEPLPLRRVSLDSLTFAASGGRAIVTFAHAAEDYRALPIFDATKDLRPEEGQKQRLFTASDLGRLTVRSSDGAELGAIRDLWLDIESKRVDFIEHAVDKGHAAAPWRALTWNRADGALESVKINKDATFVRSVPRVDLDKKHTLKHREYRELIYSTYGVKKEPDTALAMRS
jgi:sporulation protein YlmC with PRC-barrel domain